MYKCDEIRMIPASYYLTYDGYSPQSNRRQSLHFIENQIQPHAHTFLKVRDRNHFSRWNVHRVQDLHLRGGGSEGTYIATGLQD